MKVQAAIGAVPIWIAVALAPSPASAADPKHLTEAGLCRVAPGTGICTCSLSSVEIPITFGEAASTVELFYRGFPDESYVALLVSMLKQCSGEPPSAPVPPRVLWNMSGSARSR